MVFPRSLDSTSTSTSTVYVDSPGYVSSPFPGIIPRRLGGAALRAGCK